MIPVKLTLEGLYSYQKRQSIDFRNLTEAGLFGIFGEVGSGKTAILEAISFALYGETERMNSKEKRNYNMMNLKSNRMYLDFEFINFENKNFRVVREFKRNSKRFEDVKTGDTVFYENKNGDWIPLEHTSAEKILGLSYANFKRTIIIPQGQFKEFLELTPTNRTEMMKEIFNLHRFDLQNKTSVLRSENQSELDHIEGHLAGMEEVSQEILDQKQQELNNQNEKTEQIQKAHELALSDFQKSEKLKARFEELKIRTVKLSELEKLKPDFDFKEVQLNHFELIYNVFHSILKEQSKLLNQKKEVADELKQKSNLLSQTEEKLIQLNLKTQKIKSDYELLPENRIRENDFFLIIQILEKFTESENLKTRITKGQKAITDKEEEKESIREQIITAENEIEKLKVQLIPSQTIIEAGNWFVEMNAKRVSEKKQNEKILKLKTQIGEIQNRMIEKGIVTENLEQEFDKQTKRLKINKLELENQKSNFEIHQKLAVFADELHNGKPCPLCGSVEHPDIADYSDVSGKLTEIRNQIMLADESIEMLQKQHNETKIEINTLSNFKNQLADEIKQSDIISAEILKLENSFVWEVFDSKKFNDFENEKAQNLKMEGEIKLKSERLSGQRIMLEKVQVEIKKYDEHLNGLKTKDAQLNGEISQNKTNLKILKLGDFEEKPVEIVKTELNLLTKRNSEIELEYNRINESINQMNEKKSVLKTSVELFGNQDNKLTIELEEVRNQINTKLIENQIESVEKAEEVLKQNLDSQKIREEIQNFKVGFETAGNLVREIKVQLKGQNFDEEKFEVERQKLALIRSEMSQETSKLGGLKVEMQRLTKLFDTKKSILETRKKLQQRADNLSTLYYLFKGQGFVEFVSSVYLRQLCDHANLRFHRMTRNQLSLQMSDTNDFEVIDYLNEGKSRSVKTLSGGQSFQVSLSLALALAASVQSVSVSERKFFFIDEGFGTQDTESVNIVFETLMNLKKENRIVGIISHVEELKEKMGVSLRIVKDDESGSRIFVE